jgi:hypothetical protein
MGSLLNKETITLTEVIRQLDTGQPFNMVYITADRRRGTGGEIETLKNWVLHNAQRPSPKGSKESKSRIAAKLYECKPDHFFHKTRNILNLKSRKIQKLHLKLIVEYNGKNVLL